MKLLGSLARWGSVSVTKLDGEEKTVLFRAVRPQTRRDAGVLGGSVPLPGPASCPAGGRTPRVFCPKRPQRLCPKRPQEEMII